MSGKKMVNIIKGWYYKIFNKKNKLAEYRLNICDNCPNKVHTPLGEACNECGCILDAKTRVIDEKCDMNKW